MRLLIFKDVEQNTLLRVKTLEETSNIFYEIIDNPPTIEEREGCNGYYSLDENGELCVKYTEIQPTEIEKLQTKIAELEEALLSMTSISEGV